MNFVVFCTHKIFAFKVLVFMLTQLFVLKELIEINNQASYHITTNLSRHY